MNISDVIDSLTNELRALNEEFFELSCRHQKYAAKNSEDLNRSIEQAIFHEYNARLKIHTRKLMLQVDQVLYTMDEIAARATPWKKRRWWLFFTWKKSPASRVVDSYLDNFQGQFMEDLLTAVNALKDGFRDFLTQTGTEPGKPSEEPAKEADRRDEEPPEAPAPTEAPENTEEWEEWDDDPVTHKTIPSDPAG